MSSDDSYVTISVVCIVMAVVGVETWYVPVLYRNLFTVMILGCAFVVTLPMSLFNIFKGYCSSTLKHSSLYELFLPFLLPVLLFLLFNLWVLLSPTGILLLQPRVFYLMVGTAFANVTVYQLSEHFSICTFSLWKPAAD